MSSSTPALETTRYQTKAAASDRLLGLFARLLGFGSVLGALVFAAAGCLRLL